MNAIIYSGKSKKDKLIPANVEKPVIKPKEVLIQVKAISPNAADYRSINMGLIPKSKILGSGVSGVIESVGSEVENYEVGDAVLADLTNCGFGGFAEFVSAPIQSITHKPEGISFEQAACLPVAATTALNAIKKAKIQAGQEVWILGGGGGVGSYAIQLAKHFGAKVHAVCGTHNLENCLDLGADEVSDYSVHGVIKDHKSFDAILAINGNYPLLRTLSSLKKGGYYVAVGGKLAQIFKPLLFGKFLSLGSKHVKFLASKVDPSDLCLVADLTEQGFLKTPMQVEKGLDSIPGIMERLTAGHVQGKMVVVL